MEKQNSTGSQEGNEHLAVIIDAYAGAIIGKNLKGTIISWNKGAEKIYGYPATEIVGESILRLVPEQLHQEEAKLTSKLLRGESVEHHETTRIRKDGAQISISISLSPRIESGDIAGIFEITRDITIQKRMQDALFESERRHRSTLDSMLEGCQILGFNWEYLYLNQTAERHNRRPNRELLGKKMPECWPGIDQTPVFQMFNRTLKERIGLSGEVNFNFPDGHSGWFEVRSSPIPDGIFILSVDITERKKNEIELERQRRLYAALSNINHAIVRIDNFSALAHRVAEVLVKDAGLRVCWIGQMDPATGAMNPISIFGDATGCIDQLLNIYQQPGNPISQALAGSNPFICNDLSAEPAFSTLLADIRKAELSAFAVFPMISGQVAGTINVFSEHKEFFKAPEISLLKEAAEDVSFALQNFQREQQKKLLEFAAEREKKYSDALMESLPAILYFYTKDGNFLRWNKNFEKASEYNSSEILHMHPLDFFEEPDKTLVATRIELVFSQGEAHIEAVLLTKSGRKIPYLFTGKRIIFEGKPCLIGTGIEITQIREAEDEIRQLNAELEDRVRTRTAELEAANKELEAFSYSVSHDLRSPLRAVNGFADIVITNFSGSMPAEGLKYLHRIRKGGRRMGELIDDLLTFSRLGRQALRRSILNTNEIVRGVLDELTPQLAGRRIDIRVGDLPTCFADARLIQQVWLNLLGNAIKYTRDRNPAVVEIGTETVDGQIVFFVRDNGAGFDMKYAHKLFGVFQRLHRDDEFEGTGVGLAIVQRIITRHGGRVWAVAGENQGATFWFSLASEA